MYQPHTPSFDRSIWALGRPTGADAGVLAGGGECGQRLREIDWSGTRLGEPARWPASLRVVVRIMLASREPLAIWWGGGHTLLYNDACRDLLRLPEGMLGAAVPESWLEGRAGWPFSTHPIPGERGQLGGVLCTFSGATTISS